MATYLITTQELKNNTTIGGNVDSDKLLPLIYDVQIMTLENVLGTKLYDYIITNKDSLTGDYSTLYTEYIKPVLWHSVYAEYLRDGIVLAQNSGIFTHSPDDTNVADIENIKYSAKNAQSKADVYINRMIKFLCDGDTDIDEYDDSQDNDYDQSPRTVNNISGWWFGKL